MTPREVGLSVSAVIVALGLLFYWRVAWFGEDRSGRRLRDKIVADLKCAIRLRTPPREGYQQDTFSTFFLGGKKVGGELTGHNNWSLCFAFANAVWYFAYLGVQYGVWAFLLQVPWTIAVFCLAAAFDNYVDASRTGTVHGFIGSRYGTYTAVLAAAATCIGYAINCGFEIFYSIYLLAIAFDLQFVLLIALGTVFFVTACIAAGGYSANVRTNLWKNYVGLIALILLIVFLGPAYLTKFHGWGEAVWAPFAATANRLPPWYTTVGVTVFAFFFNFVDMANWQSLAANQDLSGPEKKRVKLDLVTSAFAQLFAPAFFGALLGVMLKTLHTDMADQDYFKLAFADAFPNLTMWTGAALGVVIFGFVSLTIASVDSYLLAAMQTIAVDIFRRKTAARANDDKIDPADRRAIEKSVIDWCKIYLPLWGGFTVCGFAALYYLLPDDVFNYQFVMYGAAITLFPVVCAGLLARRKAAQILDRAVLEVVAQRWSVPIDELKRQPDTILHVRSKRRADGSEIATIEKLAYEMVSTPTSDPRLHYWGFSSIATGLIFVLGPFFASRAIEESLRGYVPWNVSADAIVYLTPLMGLLAASFVYFIGFIWRFPWGATRARKGEQ